MRPGMTDALTLEEMLHLMRDAGHAHPEFIDGFEDGFRGMLVPGRWTLPYRRGVEAADQAKRRGAHRDR